MKLLKSPLKLDERNKLIALKVMAVMYILTVIYLQVVTIYRQFALGQSIHDFKDISIIMIANSLFLISALLYFGAIPIQKLRIKTILISYAAIIVFGSLFTYIKYNIIDSTGLSFVQLLDKLLIIFTISSFVMLFFMLFLFLGKRKTDKELEED